jgi:hypothetical protein
MFRRNYFHLQGRWRQQVAPKCCKYLLHHVTSPAASIFPEDGSSRLLQIVVNIYCIM